MGACGSTIPENEIELNERKLSKISFRHRTSPRTLQADTHKANMAFWKRKNNKSFTNKNEEESGTKSSRRMPHFFRSSPLIFLKRHSLPGRVDEEEEINYLKNEEARKPRSGSVKSEGYANVEDKPKWRIRKKYPREKLVREISPMNLKTNGNIIRENEILSHQSRKENRNNHERIYRLSQSPHERVSFCENGEKVEIVQAAQAERFPSRRKRPNSVSSDYHVRYYDNPDCGKGPAPPQGPNFKNTMRRMSTSSAPAFIGGKKRGPTKLTVSYEEFRRERKIPWDDVDKNLADKLAKRSEDLEILKQTAQEVSSSVSSHDAELVNDHVSGLSRKHADLEQMLSHRRQGCEQISASYDNLMKDVVEFSQWLQETDLLIKKSRPMGASVEEGEALLQEHFALIRDIESKQTSLDTIRRQCDGLLRELSPAERALIESKIIDLNNEHQRLMHESSLRHKEVARELAQREALQQEIEKVLTWIAEKEEMVEGTPTVRLKSGDIEKDMDKYKTLQNEISTYAPNVKQVEAETQKVLVDCSSEDKKPLEDKLTEISQRFSALRTKVEDILARNKRALASRKQFESDILRLELWRKETELTCSSELQLDCPLDFLDEQYKKHLALDQGTKTFESVVKDLNKRAENVSQDLDETDKTALKESLSTTKNDFFRVAVLVRKRVKQLSDALAAKSKMEGELLTSSRWLYDMQDELRRLSRTIGHRNEDAHVMLDQAHHLSERMDEYRKTMDELSTAAELAKSIGQPTAAEEVARLENLYEEMREQIQTQQAKLERAVALREAYYAAKADMDACLKSAQEQLEAVGVLGVSVPTKLDRYKTVIATLDAKAPLLAVIEDKGQQIGIEGTPSDSRAIREQIASLKVKMENLKRRAEREAAELNKVMSERSEFDNELGDNIEWLRQKETDIDARDILGLSAESIEKELDRYYDDRHGLFARLQAVHEQVQEQKSRYEQLEEAIPLEVQDRMDEFATLRETILEKLKAKGEYLNTAKEERITYNSAWRIITEWLKNADAHIKPNYDGINFETIQDQLQQHKAVFADQPMIAEKLDQLLQFSQKIEPTLDVNDKTTLKESIGNVQQRYSEVTNAAAEKDDQLAKAADKWTDYQSNLAAVDKILKSAEERWEKSPEATPSDIHDAQRQIADIEEYLGSLNRHQEDITSLNSIARELDEQASVPSQTTIEQTIRNVNERWKLLNTKANDKHRALQDAVANWSEYADTAQELNQLLAQVEKLIGETSVESLPTEELEKQLQDTQTAKKLLEENTHKLNVLQKYASSLLSKLPPSEATVNIQRETLQIQDEYEQLQSQCKDRQKNLEAEKSERERFVSELQTAAADLSKANESLSQGQVLPVDVSGVEQTLGEKEDMRRALELRLQRIQPLIEAQEERYTEEATMPKDLVDQIQNLRGLETQVTESLKECTDAINRARTLRITYNIEIQKVYTQIETVLNKLEDPTLSMDETKKLISELDALAPRFDQLQESALAIAATVPPEQREFVHADLNQLRFQWETLYGKADEKMQKLAEVADLKDRLEQDAAVVNTWIEHAKRMLKIELVWTNLHTVQQQLSEYRTLIAKATPVQGRIEEMASLADQLSSQEDGKEALSRSVATAESFETIHGEISSRLNLLEEASIQYITYANEVESVAKWMGQARQAFNAAQRAKTLQEQLSLQEALVRDIELHEARVRTILAQHEKLNSLSGNLAPTHQGEQLAGEINDLKMAAINRKDELTNALNQQEDYEKQVNEISRKISITRATLDGAPAPAPSVEGLKQQLEEHNVGDIYNDTIEDDLGPVDSRKVESVCGVI